MVLETVKQFSTVRSVKYKFFDLLESLYFVFTASHCRCDAAVMRKSCSCDTEIMQIFRAQFQGSILGPVLFNAFGNDHDTGVKCTPRKFADDNKFVGAAEFLEGKEVLQRDLHRLEG